MLISFKVSNCRSIGEEVELSMIAQPKTRSQHYNSSTFEVIQSALSTLEGLDKTTLDYSKSLIEQEYYLSLEDNKADTKAFYRNTFYNKKYNLHILKSAALYGANASGKTNILSAFVDGIKIIRGGKIEVETKVDSDTKASFNPNKNEEKYSEIPTKYTYKLLINNELYQYTFAHNAEQIMYEELLHFPNNISHYDVIYKRLQNKIEIGLSIKKVVDKNILNSIELLQDKQELFIKELDKLGKNNDKYKLDFIEHISNIFNNNISSLINKINPGQIQRPTFLAMREDKEFRKYVYTILSNADFLIKEIIIRGNNGSTEIDFKHKNTNQLFSLAEESSGTRILLELLHFWFTALKDGDITVFDELGNSMHPALAIFLIQQFHNNTKTNAQLIYTTHYTQLMDDELVCEDQIKIVNRNENGNTSLVNSADFSALPNYTRRDSVYLQGVFGGTPYIDNEPIKIKISKNGI